MKKFAVIVAGGKGLRMGKELPKQFLLLAGKPIVVYAIEAFLNAFQDIQIILVLPADFIEYTKSILSKFKPANPILFVEGGATRFDSVKNGLNPIKENGIVFVHDGARPLLSIELLQRCYQGAIENGNAIPAIPVAESIRQITGATTIPINRDQLRIIQTPQTFKTETLINVFNCNYRPEFTDEATVAEMSGITVHLIAGDKKNIKITTPEDLLIAEAFLNHSNDI